MLVFRKFCIRTTWITPYQVSLKVWITLSLSCQASREAQIYIKSQFLSLTIGPWCRVPLYWHVIVSLILTLHNRVTFLLELRQLLKITIVLIFKVVEQALLRITSFAETYFPPINKQIIYWTEVFCIDTWFNCVIKACFYICGLRNNPD